MIVQAFVLAAGLGTRMGALTRETPKALLPYQGRAMLDHILDTVELAGTKRVVVNIHAGAEQMREHLSTRDVLLSDESNALQGTGGAIGFAYEKKLLLDEPCLTHNCDVLLGSNGADNTDTSAAWAAALSALSGAFRAEMGALLLLTPRAKTDKAGDFSFVGASNSTAGRIIAGTDFVYTGVQILSPKLFQPKQREMKDLWVAAQTHGGLYGAVLAGDWFHLGTKKEWEALSPPDDAAV